MRLCGGARFYFDRSRIFGIMKMEKFVGMNLKAPNSIAPNDGLEITLTNTQEKVLLPHAFEAAVNEDDIFVFCSSTVLSSELAHKFKASACIEIHRPAKFIAEIRGALKRRASVRSKMLVHGPVNYYEKEDSSPIDWALPERIAMSKLDTYARQCEYRVAFAVNDAFRVENTHLRLVVPGERRMPRSFMHPEHLLKLGSLSQVCRIHRFASHGA